MHAGRAVPPEWVDLLLEAARWAPSSRNAQPWRYLVFDGRVPEALQAARECLTPGNQVWASRSPVLILAVAQTVQENGKVNAKALHDLGMANENLLLQAIALGLHCRPMGGFDVEKARHSFCIPEGYEPVVMIAIGHPGQTEDLAPEVRERAAAPRTRRPLEKLVHLGEWGVRYPTSMAAE